MSSRQSGKQDKFLQIIGIVCALEKTKSVSFGSSMPIIVGSVQTLSQEKRLSCYLNDYFIDIVIDEQIFPNTVRPFFCLRQSGEPPGVFSVF